MIAWLASLPCWIGVLLCVVLWLALVWFGARALGRHRADDESLERSREHLEFVRRKQAELDARERGGRS